MAHLFHMDLATKFNIKDTGVNKRRVRTRRKDIVCLCLYLFINNFLVSLKWSCCIYLFIHFFRSYSSMMQYKAFSIFYLKIQIKMYMYTIFFYIYLFFKSLSLFLSFFSEKKKRNEDVVLWGKWVTSGLAQTLIARNTLM